jgi:thiol:disulfide interchange protein DsbA
LQRRHFSALAAASLGLGVVRTASAQDDPVDGLNYKRIQTPVPVDPPAGSVDVVEFFSFACPFCFRFEPTLEAWLKRKPADIRFRRSPVPFELNYVNFQPMYFALEAMGLVDTLQQKVFNAVHLEHQRLDKPEAIAAFMTKNGVDATRFMAMFNSFGVRTRVQQANALMAACDVDNIPTLVVQGRFRTSPALAKGEDKCLAVADYLAAQVHAGH